MVAAPHVSVLIPARNEARNLDFLLDEIGAALAGRSFEILVIDDGSTDDTGALIAGRRRAGLPVRHIRHEQAFGKSAALRTGLTHARGAVIVTLDGDGQNDPVYIPPMLDMLADEKTALIVGQRQNRTDGGPKKYASRFANGVRGWLLADGARDSGCGLRVIRREVFALLPFFDGQHRFLPALVQREGHGVAFHDIVDRPRRYGESHYGIMDRGLRGIYDLFGVIWLKRRFRGRANGREVF